MKEFSLYFLDPCNEHADLIGVDEYYTSALLSRALPECRKL